MLLCKTREIHCRASRRPWRTNDQTIQSLHHFPGYNPKVNYLVVKVSRQKIELELKELDIVCKGPKLWQEGRNRPRETVVISEEIKKRGYISVGRMAIDKTGRKRTTRDKTGYFDENNNPK